MCEIDPGAAVRYNKGRNVAGIAGEGKKAMKILLIGGTGIISTEVSRRLIEENNEVYLLNRGSRALPNGAKGICCDIHDRKQVEAALGELRFDSVADFIAFDAADVARDLDLFGHRTKQYIFVSSASAYQKPPKDFHITEETPLANPYWQYSHNKIEAEEYLKAHRLPGGAAVTVVRPSHTYCERSLPLAVKGERGPWSVVRRILEEKPVLIHGDGSSLWTITHSADFAQGFAGLVGNPNAYGEAVQITSGEALSWTCIYEIIADELGQPLHPFYVASEFLAQAGSAYDFCGKLLGDKAHSVLFDTAKLKLLVPDYRPHISAEEGLRASVRYLLSHPELQQEDPAFDAWTDRVIAAQKAALEQLV